MTFKQFTALATVAKHLNITKAAQALRVSQPSLSKHLKTLEDDFGVRLFFRTKNGIRFTQEGYEFLTLVGPILTQLRKIEARFINGISEVPRGRLQVGGTYGPSAGILPYLLSVFRKTHSGVEITLHSASARVIYDLMLKGDVDIAVCTIRPRSSQLIAEPYMTLKLVAFTRKDNAIAGNRALTLADLEKIPLIVGTTQGLGGTIETMLRTFKKHGCRPNIAMRCESPEAVKAAVRERQGIGFLYEDAVKWWLREGSFKAVKISGVQMTGPSYIVVHKKRPLSSSGELFLKLLRDYRDQREGKRKTRTGQAPGNEYIP